ncbi:MAG: bifunctional proline dehydrogenase/L-glutamate gamma-semialdehyde dehydrogenase PutA [Pseudomonadota bacterium]
MSSDPQTLLREKIREHCLIDEAGLAQSLIKHADIGEEGRTRAREQAALFVVSARENASRTSLIDKFLQEYGLSTSEGVTLMRLAEALLRTPDSTTADALIQDKVDAGDWAAHKGQSPFPLVNFSTRALMVTAAWLDEIEDKNPLGRVVQSTKAILDRVGDPIIRAAVGQAMKIMGEHFVLGETIQEALKRGQSYKRQGYTFSFDMLGEAALTAKDAKRYFEDYSEAIKSIAGYAPHDNTADNPGISVKLSALHPRYEFIKRNRVLSELFETVRILAISAKGANIGFNIDAEESERLDISLDLIGQLLNDPALAGWDGFGVVVQAYQRRALPVLQWLAESARAADRRVMVRLVKGAYWDAEVKRAQVLGLETYPVFTRKVLTDVSYQACSRFLLENRDVFYPQFATHNALTATTVQEMARQGETDPHDSYELQRLHGMGEALHDKLIEDGARSRIYAPVGGHKELLPYLVRRLLENGANSSFVNQLIDPEMSVDDIVADPVIEARTLDQFANPAIRTPRDLFAQTRLSARGWDVADPVSAFLLSNSETPLAVADVRQSAPNEHRSGEEVIVHSPADRKRIVGTVTTMTAQDVVSAVERAKAAQSTWRQTSVSDRVAILQYAADLMEAEDQAFFRIARIEAGKTIEDAIAEVREAVDFLRYYANEAVILDDAGKADPLGTVVCISPWNFPLAIFTGQVSAALAVGNTVLAKPAEQTPLMAAAAVDLLHRAGVPEDALVLCQGDGPGVGAALTSHSSVDGVIFTGSTEVAKIINRSIAASSPRAPLIAETGGINAMIIDSTALLEQAVVDVVASAFQSAGQRCSACRFVCVQEDVADRFIEMLAGAMAEGVVSDPANISTDVGPVIDKEAFDKVSAAISRLRTNATEIGIMPMDGDATANGFFVEPTAFEVGSINDINEEIFGPVLQIVRYRAPDLESTVQAINQLGFGLTLGIHTRIDETMHKIVALAKVGNIYVNRNQIGAVVGVQPFGGEGLSGTGPKAGGPHYLPALVKKSAPEASFDIKITETYHAPMFDQSMTLAREAFEQWRQALDRLNVLMSAAQFCVQKYGDAAVETDILRRAITIMTDHEAPLDLPGPTGEANSLRLRAKGLVACIGPGERGFARQASKALGTGNGLLCPERFGQRLAEALKAAGAPANLIVCLPFPNLDEAPSQVPAAMLDEIRINAIALDCSDASIGMVKMRLANRDGAIIQLLSSADPVDRFCVERTVTINTTAAGGDVRLLSLPE